MFTNTIAKPAFEALELIKAKNFLSSFYMAGGTACSIQIGHRISVDLDFFSDTNFEPQELLSSVKNEGVELQNFELSKGTLKGWISDAQLSFFSYPYKLVSPLVDFENNVRLASLLDIGLMKLTAIASRGSKKDFVDLFFILKQHSLTELFSNFENKFTTDQINKYHYLKSLVYFDDADIDPNPNMLVEFDWKEIKQYFSDLIAETEI